MSAVPVRLIAEARAVNADQRYGAFSHPVSLGLLIAADIARSELERQPCGTPDRSEP